MKRSSGRESRFDSLCLPAGCILLVVAAMLLAASESVLPGGHGPG